MTSFHIYHNNIAISAIWGGVEIFFIEYQVLWRSLIIRNSFAAELQIDHAAASSPRGYSEV